MSGDIKKKCFVIGPIGSVGTQTRKDADFLLKGIVRPALDGLGLVIWRADEDSRPGMITDRLILDLYESDLVIADLSELNPNAFYELGIRHASGKPTIHIASSGTKLPFDNAGHLAILFDKTDWDSIEAAKSELRNQSVAAISPDFKTSNPVVQALSFKAFNASDNPIEKAVGELMKRVEYLESSPVRSTNATADSHYFKMKNTYDRELYLHSKIKKLVGTHGPEKYNITDEKIDDYIVKMNEPATYDYVVKKLDSSAFEQILYEIGMEE